MRAKQDFAPLTGTRHIVYAGMSHVHWSAVCLLMSGLR